METPRPPELGKETALISLSKTPPSIHKFALLNLRISVTDRCQLRCSYCIPAEGMPKRSPGEILSFEEIIHFVRVVKSGFEVSKVRITGGEPLVRPGIVELIGLLSREGIADLTLTTNGQELAQMASDLKGAGLHRVNVSLDSLNERTFRALTGGGRLQQSVAGIKAALCQGLRPVKINMVVLRGINDHEVTSLAHFGLERGCQVRFLELMPIGCAKKTFDDLFVPAWEVREHLASCFNLKAISCQAGQSSRNFQASDRLGHKGIIGFISPTTEPFCHDCRRVRLTSTGQLIFCLAKGCGPDVRNLLQNDTPTARRVLLRIVGQQFCQKRSDRKFHTHSAMVGVGG